MRLNRVIFLIQQNRYELATSELQQMLSEDPDQAKAHAFLAFSLNRQKKAEEAIEEAKLAIQLDPTDSYGYFVLGYILMGRFEYEKAAEAAKKAVSLNPHNPENFALCGDIQVRQQTWDKVLQTALAGLQVSPRHIGCQNLQAIALLGLNRQAEAQTILNQTLSQSPETPLTWVWQGWLTLEQGQPQAAMDHFQEALHLNPLLNGPRRGMIQAFKSQYALYRFFRKSSRRFFQLRTERIFISFLLCYWLFFNSPGALIFELVLGCYLLLIYGCWTYESFFNLRLRLHPKIRLFFSEDDLIATNWTWAGLGLGLAGGLLWFVSGYANWLAVSLYGLLMILPFSAIFRTSPASEGRLRASFGTLILIVLGFTATLAMLLNTGIGFYLAGIFIFGIFIFAFAISKYILRQIETAG